MIDKILKYQKRAEKNLRLSKDLSLILKTCDIPHNYKSTINQSISSHKKAAKKELKKCLKMMENEPTGEKKG